MNTKLTPLAKLVLTTKALVVLICLGIAWSIMLWANETDFRPLKANLTMEEAVKASNALDTYKIEYRIDFPRHTILVDEAEYARAVVAVQSAGVELPPLPKYSEQVVKAMDSARVEEDYKPVYQQPWFIKIIRLCLAALVICVLFISVIRPLVKDLKHWFKEPNMPPDDSKEKDEIAHEAFTGGETGGPGEDFFGKVDVLSQAKLFIALLLCIGLAFTIIVWAKLPAMRPLINNLRTVDAVKIADMLSQHGVSFKTDTDSHILYVSEEQEVKARLVLAQIGVKVEYSPYAPLDKALLEHLEITPTDNLPYYYQPWFMRVTRLALSAIVIIVLIVVVMRPILRILIFPGPSDIPGNKP